MNKRIWVNFKELRAQLKFEDVLRHYGVEVQRKGSQHQGMCPLPQHKRGGDSLSFSANLERGIFQCFSCGAKGNVVEFAALMEGIDITDGNAFRKVAIGLQQQFLPKDEGRRNRGGPNRKSVDGESTGSRVVVNAPLDFELKGLDSACPRLAAEGFVRETLAYFGVGLCSRGLLKDRIAIPLHDLAGRAIGYAGRIADQESIDDSEPEYLFPTKREREGTTYEFNRSLFVYNGNRVKKPSEDLIITGSFPSVWWLHQNGFPGAVAVMGPECSEKQAELIVSLVEPSGRVWIMPDKAGEYLAGSLLAKIAPHRFVRWVRLGGVGREPTDLSARELKACFAM